MQTIKLIEENIRENTTLSLDTSPKTSMKEKHCKLDLIGGSDGEESACNVRDLGSIPGLGRSPGGGHGNPLQYSCLENPH